MDVVTLGAARADARRRYAPVNTVADVATANGALLPGQHNPVSAASGARAMTLANASAGVRTVVEKTDSSANAVTVTLNLRGSSGATLTLTAQNEAIELLGKADGSWWPVAGHRTKASLDAVYATSSPLGAERLRSAPAARLQTWLASLGNRDAALARAVVIGDSVAEGHGATALGKGWLPVMQARLRARFPTAGLTGGGFGYIPTRYVSPITSPWTSSGTVPIDSSQANGLGLRARYLSAGGSLTISVTGTAVDILYLKSSTSRVFGWAVDGGAVTNVDTISGTGSASDTGIVRIAMGASGTRTLTLTRISGSDPYIEGVIVYDSDELKGVQVLDAAHHSFETTEFATAPALTNHSARVASLGPALVVVALGENDWLHNKSSATMRSNLVAIVNGIKAQMTVSPSFVLMSNFRSVNASPAEPWENYVAAMYGAAEDVAAVPLDLSQRMPPVSGDVLGLYADQYHPNNKGHAMMADPILETVSPR